MILGVLCFISNVHIHITTRHNSRNTYFILCEYQIECQTMQTQQLHILLPKKTPLIFLVLADLIKPTHQATKEDRANKTVCKNLAQLNSLSSFVCVCVCIMVTGSRPVSTNSCECWNFIFYFFNNTTPGIPHHCLYVWKETATLL